MEEGVRRTALSIRSLKENDQRWLLARLPEAVQEKVWTALQELGVTTGEPATVGMNGRDHAGDSLSTYVSTIDQATAAEIVMVLADVPDWLAGCVLGHQRWSWTESYWQALSPARRNTILAAMKRVQSSVKPRTQAAVMEVLARAVTHEKGAASVNGHESFETILKTLEQEPEIPRKGWRFKWIR